MPLGWKAFQSDAVSSFLTARSNVGGGSAGDLGNSNTDVSQQFTADIGPILKSLDQKKDGVSLSDLSKLIGASMVDARSLLMRAESMGLVNVEQKGDTLLFSLTGTGETAYKLGLVS